MRESPESLDVGFLIRLIYDAIERGVNRDLKPVDLTQSQSIVLAYLRSRKSSLTYISDIQEFMGVSHPTMLGIVRRLEKKGFVHVLVDPDDRRMRQVVLDEERERLFAQTGEGVRNDVEERILSGLNEEERRQIKDLLVRVYKNIR